jgi:hypothetical protein
LPGESAGHADADEIDQRQPPRHASIDLVGPAPGHLVAADQHLSFLRRWCGKACQIESAHAVRVEHDTDGGLAVEFTRQHRRAVAVWFHQQVRLGEGTHGEGWLDAAPPEFLQRYEYSLSDGAHGGRTHAIVERANGIGQGVPHHRVQTHRGLQGE